MGKRFETVFKKEVLTSGKVFLGSEDVVKSYVVGRSDKMTICSQKLEEYSKIRAKFGFTDSKLYRGENAMIKNYVQAWYQELCTRQIIHQADHLKG